MSSPVITIFVRHNGACKQTDEQWKRCTCRKHFRWSTGQGKELRQYRQAANTRSWAEAEELKRKLEDQLSGVVPISTPETTAKPLSEAATAFLDEKRVQNVSRHTINVYTLDTARFIQHMNAAGVYHVQGVTRELLTSFCATWPTFLHSSFSRFRMRERVQGFVKFCYDNEWMRRKLPLPLMTIDEPPTMPLTPEEFDRLLAATKTLKGSKFHSVTDEYVQARCRSLFLLMRWTGLAISDALTLERAEMHHDKEKGIYRVVTERMKTGTHVSVPLHPKIAEEILATPTDNPKYIFWSGTGDPRNVGIVFNKYVLRAFAAAGIVSEGHMKSHRLRDTFAVEMLQKGIPMEEVSKLLGHESIRTTEKSYAKWVKGRQDRLDSLVTATWETERTA